MAGQQRKALEICEATLADLRRVFGRDTVEALEFLDFAATACAELQLPEQEEAHLREFVRISGLMFGQSGEPTATALARLGKQLLRRQRWEAAEPTLRQCLRIREELDRNPSIPLPRWVVPNTRCLLGEALLGQKKYAEAEPLLVGGAEQLMAEHGSVPPKEREIIQHAIDHVVQLYTATGNRAKADEWRNRTVPVLPAVVPIPLASD